MTIPKIAALALAGFVTALPSGIQATAPILRTAYLTAVDAAGGFVTDLSAADVVVKENRQLRDVVRLEPATDRLHVAVLVDDGGEGGMQTPVAQLMSLLDGQAAFSLSMLNPQPFKLNDYSTDDGILKTALGKIRQRGRTPVDPLQVIEAISWAAKDQQKRELTRRVIVALTVSGEPGKSYISDDVIEDLRTSGAQLHVVYAGGVQMGRVLMDGPARSGGSHTVANSTASFAQALISVGRMLTRQYKLTYMLPDGVKAHQDLEVTTTRAGVKLVAPTRMPTK
jgi:hypothetical protein